MPDTKEATLEIDIVNTLGLHARPASMLVKLASTFESEITVEKDGEEVDGKSLMGLLMLSAGSGSKIRISARGPDCESAMEAIISLINSKFGED